MIRDDKEELEGYTCLSIDGQDEYHVSASDYEKILSAFTTGKAFVETKTMYLEDITIKLARITSVALHTPESMAWRAKQEEEWKKKSLTE